jgi:hypothetical protein
VPDDPKKKQAITNYLFRELYEKMASSYNLPQVASQWKQWNTQEFGLYQTRRAFIDMSLAHW